MRKLLWPVQGIGLKPNIFYGQGYYANPVAVKDMWMGKTLVKAGQRIYAAVGLKSHGGIDITAPHGTPVMAVSDGFIVEQVNKDTGFGLRISQLIPLPDGTFWLVVYGHFARTADQEEIPYNFWRRSKPVAEGQVIGYVGSTGFSSGNHLHISLYRYDSQGNKMDAGNGNFGQIDIQPHMKIRAFLSGYRKHPEKDIVFRLDSMERLQWFFDQVPDLADAFQVEKDEYVLPLDKPPFPIP
jgi:murein DD-endopeptidase MepM/ murein hydrolase activator NlpD